MSAAARCCGCCRASNEDVTEEWISDKTRFALTGSRGAASDRPFVRPQRPARGKRPGAMPFGRHRRGLSRCEGSAVAAIAGDLADAEAMWRGSRT